MPYLECPVSLLTGATSAGSSASVKREKPLGTSHIKILPSSEPDAIMRSLKGCLVTKATSSAQLSKGLASHFHSQWLCVARKQRTLFVPVGIQDNSSVPTEQWYLVGQLAPLVHGDDCECATAARLPIDRQVFRIGLVIRVYIVSDRVRRGAERFGWWVDKRAVGCFALTLTTSIPWKVSDCTFQTRRGARSMVMTAEQMNPLRSCPPDTAIPLATGGTKAERTIGIPRIPTDVEVIIAELLPHALAEDVS